MAATRNVDIRTPNTCVLYARVSTKKQADGGISVPDQLARGRDFAQQLGKTVLQEYVDAGRSARTDDRPEFQRMIRAALSDPPQASMIIVHSLSRFYRDEAEGEILLRRLTKAGVEVRSLSQDFGSGSAGQLARRLIGLIDEQHSQETAKHVTRGLYENARQGFWNGSIAPLGYEAHGVTTRGVKIKKHLRIVESEAEIVRLIFRLTLEGDGVSGPLGMKNLAKWLNNNGYRDRRGKRFSVQKISKILHHEGYTGRHWFGKADSKGNPRPRHEWVDVRFPAIITDDAFARVQAHLRDRRPDVTAPRITTSNLMLGGVARCRACGRAMQLQTGKGASGGVYRYYVCSGKLKEGSCEGGAPARMPVPNLDDLVLTAVIGQVLTADFAREVVGRVVERRTSGHGHAIASLERLRAEAAQASRRQNALLRAITDEVIIDNDLVREQFKALQDERSEIQRLIATHEKTLETSLRPLEAEQAARVAEKLKARLAAADPKLKKRFIRALISGVFVGKQKVVIQGPESALAEIAAGLPMEQAAPPLRQVRVLVQEWCWGSGSN